VLDGVYRCGAGGVPGFFEAGAPTDDELDALLHTIIARLMKMLTRRGRSEAVKKAAGAAITQAARQHFEALLATTHHFGLTVQVDQGLEVFLGAARARRWAPHPGSQDRPDLAGDAARQPDHRARPRPAAGRHVLRCRW